MAKRYRRPAPKRAKRINHDHGGVPQLAAQIAGVSVFTVYGVIYGRVKSARVQRAIDEAERQLRRAKGRAA
jgi:hypothetical protein